MYEALRYKCMRAQGTCGVVWVAEHNKVTVLGDRDVGEEAVGRVAWHVHDALVLRVSE